MDTPDVGTVTRLLKEWREGRPGALDQLTPLIYNELRRLAAAYLRHERPGHTIQSTALVHEAYLRLVDQTSPDFQNRTHFFGVAANLMRQILVNYAGRHRAAKRGGGNKAMLDEAALLGVNATGIDLLALNEALKKLATKNPRLEKIVELRFFCGLTEDEIGEVLEISARTVKRDWQLAKAWLYGELAGGGADISA